MKTRLSLICLLFLTAVGCNYSPRVVWIETTYVIESTDYMKNAQILFDQKAGKMELELDSLTAAFQKLQEPALAAELAQSIRQKQANYNQFSAEYSQRLLNDVYGKVNKDAKEFAAKQGYNIILGTTENGHIMHADSGINVSEAFIEFINSK